MPERSSMHLDRLKKYMVEMEEKIDALEHMQHVDSGAAVSPGKIDLDLNFMLRYLAKKVEEQLGLTLEVSNELSDEFEMDRSTSLEMLSFLWRTCVLVLMFGEVNKATLDVTADYDHIYLELVYIDVDWKRSNLYPIYKQVEGMLEIEDAEVHIGWIRDHCHVTAAFAK